MDKNRIFDIIISLLIGIKNGNQLQEGSSTLTGCSYLLNQTIRQYQIPLERYYVSEKAQALWKRIKSNGARITWLYLEDLMSKNDKYVIEVDDLLKKRIHKGN